MYFTAGHGSGKGRKGEGDPLNNEVLEPILGACREGHLFGGPGTFDRKMSFLANSGVSVSEYVNYYFEIIRKYN